MSGLTHISGVELARRIRTGEVRSIEAVEAHIERIEAVNPSLNAMVADRFDRAREEARAADAALASGREDLPPFHGVPCSIKECFQLEGMPNSTGLIRRRHVRSTTDAPTVARLRRAGCIPLGVTNISELCLWYESDNPLYGRTNNPYDRTRIAGGSSGGEGAIVAACGAPFGLGSDVGGSIRLPSYFNGIFGHKATSGLIPNAGQYPPAEGEVLHYLTTGPMTRHAEDLWPLIQVLAGPEMPEDECVPMVLGSPAEVDVSKLRVIRIPDDGRHSVEAELARSHARVARHLEGLGCRVEERTVPDLKHGFDIWSAMLQSQQQTPFQELMEQGDPIRLRKEIARTLAGRSEFTTMSVVLALAERVTARIPGRTERFVALGEALRSEMLELLGTDGILLFPTYPRTAPRHGSPVRRTLRLQFEFAYTCVLNALRLPVTQVPLGLDSAGLPMGIQVVGSPGADHVTVAVALELERAFGGWQPPPIG